MQGAGLFSKIGGYVAGMAHGARGVNASMLGRNVQAGYNAGQLGRHAWSSLGSAGQRTVMGAGAGAAWGMASGDTSVLGGAAMGAGIGRYGGRALMQAGRGGHGLGFGAHVKHAGAGFGRGAFQQARSDVRGIANWGRGAGASIKSNAQAGWAAAKARATAAPAGATVSSNAPMNPVASSHSIKNGTPGSVKRDVKGLRGAELEAAVAHNMNVQRNRRMFKESGGLAAKQARSQMTFHNVPSYGQS